jgi:hypothetical protein
MIQRIQTLFLILIVAVSATLFFLPLSTKYEKGQTIRLQVMYENDANKENLITVAKPDLLILNLLIIAAAAYAIFLYRNRNAQMRMCMIGSLMALTLLILVFYHSDGLQGGNRPEYQAGTYIVAVQSLLFIAARRYIRKDELLVRSADRIR